MALSVDQTSGLLTGIGTRRYGGRDLDVGDKVGRGNQARMRQMPASLKGSLVKRLQPTTTHTHIVMYGIMESMSV